MMTLSVITFNAPLTTANAFPTQFYYIQCEHFWDPEIVQTASQCLSSF